MHREEFIALHRIPLVLEMPFPSIEVILASVSTFSQQENTSVQFFTHFLSAPVLHDVHPSPNSDHLIEPGSPGNSGQSISSLVELLGNPQSLGVSSALVVILDTFRSEIRSSLTCASTEFQDSSLPSQLPQWRLLQS